MLGKIKAIEEVHDVKIASLAPISGENKRLGMLQMIDHLFCGYSPMDGYEVETDNHTFHVLINNEQNCCENWGYLSSEDDLNYFIGAELTEVRLTDKALNQCALEKSGYYGDKKEIQFVDFVTDKGIFQLAVYNAHNGYYGHGILVAKDGEVLLNDIL